MNEIILLKYGEIALKGLNKSVFESMLMKTCRRRVRDLGEFKIYKSQSTMYCEPVSPDADIDGAFDRLSKVFGFAGIARAAVVEKDYDEMIQEICREANFTSIVATQIEGDRKVEASRLADLFRKYTDAAVYAEPDVERAFSLALEQRGAGMLFCAGSLYLVGEIKAIIEKQTVQKH